MDVDLKEKMHHTQGDSMLLMNFSILHHDNEADQLLLNGMPLYPIDLRQAMNEEGLTADQLFKAPNNIWMLSSTTTLGYSMTVRHPIKHSAQDQVSLTALHINVIEVAEKFMTGIPSIEVKLLETPSGKLMIADAEIMAPDDLSSEISGPHSAAEQECITLLCKWKAIITAKLSEMKKGALKGCGSKARPAKAHPQAATEFKPHHEHDRPRVGGHHRGHRHHRPSAFARFVRGLVLHVLIPITIGIMVGIFASLVGMIAGHLAIFMWRLVFRRGSNTKYARVKQVEAVEETKPFIDAQGPPPEYEEAIEEKV